MPRFLNVRKRMREILKPEFRADRVLPDYCQLEDRVLLSAAPIDSVLFGDNLDLDPPAESICANLSFAYLPQDGQPTDGDVHAADGPDQRIESGHGLDADLLTADESPSSHESIQTHEVVFVDGAADDCQRRVTDLLTSADDTHKIEVVPLDPTRDGIDQITEALAEFADLDAVHVVSDGTNDAAKLGNGWLSLDSVGSYAGQLVRWRDALAADADIVLQGEDLSASDDGRLLVESLSTLTEANVFSTSAELDARSLVASVDETTDSIDTANSTPSEVDFATVTLAFERNEGQTDGQVDYLARGSGYSIFLTEGDAVLQLGSDQSVDAVRMHLVGGDEQAQAVGQRELLARSNYFVGSQNDWLTDVSNFASVQYDDIYEGIDVRYYGNQRQLEYDFIVAAGVDAGTIRLKFEGADGVHIDDDGSLIITMPSEGETIRFQAPYSYQETDSGRQTVESRYRISADGTVGFALGEYDASRQLVIDPILDYGTYLGGSGMDRAYAIDTDAAGNTYITGVTRSADFPVQDAYDSQISDDGVADNNDIFLTKLSAGGGAVLYSTFFGGSGSDSGNDVKVDADGSVYLTGETQSADFPTTPGAADTVLAGTSDAFVTKLNATGSVLEYSTFVGGTKTDDATAIAIDDAGNVYITGRTESRNQFPLTPGAPDSSLSNGDWDGFLVKLNATGTSVAYGTYLGGSAWDGGNDIAVDDAGNATVTGYTASADFSMAGTPYDNSHNGGDDVFLTQLNVAGTALTYSTFFGGAGEDEADAIAIDSSGNIYLTGDTTSANFPTTIGAYDETHNGSTDAFVVKFTAGKSLDYATFFGGPVIDRGNDIAVDSSGQAHIVGQAWNGDIPTTADAYQDTRDGIADVFVATFDAAGANLVYATYLGAAGIDYGESIALDSANNVYVTGYTDSAGFDTTSGAYDETYSGSDDAFVVKFLGSEPPAIDLDADDSSGAGGADFAAIWAEGGGPVAIVDASDATLTDVDSTDLESLTVTLVNPADGTAEILAADTTGTGIIASYDPPSGVLTLTNTDTVAHYQQVLRTITYDNTSEVSDTTARVITFVANDGHGNSNTATATVTINATNDQPTNIIPGPQSTTQDIALMFSTANSNALAVSDPDANGADMEVTLSATNGTLTLNPANPVGGDVLINTTTAESQLNADVAMDPDGSWVAVWQSYLQDGAAYGVFAQRFDAAGNPVGSEFQVNTVWDAQQTIPAVAVDGAGNFVIVWQSSGQDPGNRWSIFGQRYDADGNPLGGEFQVNSTTSNDQTAPDIAMDVNGNFVVVWEGDGAGDASGVFGRRYDSSGNAQGSEFLINTHTNDAQEDPRIAMDDGGDFVVVWRSDLQDGDAGGIYGQRFNASGLAQGAEFRINETTTGSQYWSDVAIDVDGDFVVAWSDDVQGLMARRYDASGVAQGGELNTSIGGNMAPSVAMDADGNFTIARESGGEIIARSYRASGAPRGDAFQVNATTPGIQPNPSIGMNGGGEFVIAWDGTGPGDTSGTFAQRYSAPDLNFSNGDGTDDATMTFTGTIADINDALDGLTFTPTEGYNGPASLQIQTSDLGNTGTGGPLTDNDTVDIIVDAAADHILVVTTADDTADAPDTSSISALLADRGADGRISLREALLATNNTANIDVNTPDEIHFNIPEPLVGGAHTIQPTSVLPDISEAVIINGATDPDFAGTPIIELDGSLAGAGADGLRLISGSSGSTIRGLVINRFSDEGIEIQAGSNGHLIAGNYIGTDVTGTLDRGNAGEGIDSRSRDHVIGGTSVLDRNVISGGSRHGLFLVSANNIQVLGNYIGTDATGTVALGNSFNGISLASGGTNVIIGGTAAGAGNLVSGNQSDGIALAGGTSGATVQGNLVGTNAAGDTALANSGVGIVVGGTSHTVGGTMAESPNISSGNTSYGIHVWATNSTVQGNYVGIDITGTAALGNSDIGVYVTGADNTIGGTAAGAGNLIAHNSGPGIAVSGATGTALLGNILHSNTALGIDLDENGVTVNDGGSPPDQDTGANNRQNFPVLTSAATNGVNAITVDGTLDSTPNTDFRIEFFASATGDGSGYGEAERYLGATTVTTDGSGNASFSAPLTVGVADGEIVTATATVDLGGGHGDTSEFAQNVAATLIANSAPTLSDTVVTLNSTAEDSPAPSGAVGTLISSLADLNPPAGGQDNVTDADSGALTGVAVIGADTANGSWWYTTNGGTNWNVLGAVAANNAQLLAADVNTRLYFQPNGDYNGTIANAITFHAWDQTSGTNGEVADPTGGDTAFSAATDFASLTVTAVNDDPIVTSNGGGPAAGVNVAENTTSITTVAGNDVDGDTVTFSITGGGDQALFSIDTNSGVLTFDSAPDFETPADANTDNVYEVTVEASDGNGGSDSQSISVTVSNQVITSVTATGNASVVAGSAYTLNLGADEDATGWTINWGDGTVDTIVGDPATATHTYSSNQIGLTFAVTASATDAEGTYFDSNLLLADFWGDTAEEYHGIAGNQVQEFTSNANLAGPADVLIGPDGLLYVSGYNSDTIVRYNASTGAFVDTFVSAGLGGLDGPTGLAFGKDGNLLVASYNTDSVKRYDATTGAYIDDFVTSGAGGLDAPVALTYGADGNLYVTGWFSNTVVRYDGDTGAFIDVFVSTSLDQATDLQFGPDGNLYVASRAGLNSGVDKYDGSTGAILGNVLSMTSTFGITFGPDGGLYVSSETGDDVGVYDTSGTYLRTLSDSADGISGPWMINFTPDQQVTVVNPINRLFVDTTDDVSDGDTSSIAALKVSRGADGKISLREAIVATNNTANVDGSTPDEIYFHIADALVNGAHTISLSSGLPDITDPLVIDGWSEPDFSTAPVVRLDGNGIGGSVDGLTLSSSADNSLIRGLMITRFSRHGIQIDGGADGVVIAGNWIGTTGTGSIGVGNTDTGINVQGANTTIGGTGANEGNVITNNANEGINVTGAGATGTIIQGNIIGLDPDGATGGGNTDVGIALLSGAHNTTIGGSTASARNIISNNYEGIEINSNNNTVQGNYIGTDITGTLDRGNRSDDGVELKNNATGNLIGGTTAGAGNLIAFNALDGVYIVSGTGNSVLGNVIHANTGLGINLAGGTEDGFGVTGNDGGPPYDTDTGANDLQNYPVLTSAVTDGGTTITIAGGLSSTASTTFRIEFFASTAFDPSGFGEGERYLGYANVTTDITGGAVFSIPLAKSVSAGDFIAATATDAAGNTSEFAQLLVATLSNVAPTIGLPGGSVNYTEGDGKVAVDSSATASDPDSADFDGGTLTVDFTANGTTNDRLAIRNEGTNPGQIGVSGSNVTYNFGAGAVTIGMFAGGTDGSTPLVITFNGSATPTAAQALMRNITYDNVSEDPSESARTVRFVLTDGDGGTSNAVTETINVTAANDAPTLTSFAAVIDTTNEDTEIELTLAELKAQGDEADVDGTVDAFVVESVTSGTLKIGTTAGTATAWAAGTNDTIDATNHAYWTPAADVSGTRNAFAVVAQDDQGAESMGNVTIQVSVTLVNDEEVLATNAGTTVNEASSGNVITTAMLETTDVDNIAAELTYTVTSAIGNGTLRLSGTALGVSDTFTQADIDAGQVTYDHDGSETVSDSFDFSVDDGAGTSTSGTFNITVTPVNDEQVLATNTGTTVNEASTGNVLTTAMLETTDTDNTPAQLVYTVTTATGNGTLRRSGTAVGVSDTFTQADIDAGLVTYGHDGSETVSDSFDFSVDDGAGASTSGNFNITVTPVNDEEVLATNTGTMVNEASAGNVLTGGMLQTTDVDNAPAQLAYTVTAAAGNGTLRLSGTALGASDTFTQADIDAGLVTYDHDGSETASDSFDFNVDDGAGTSTSGTFGITVTPVNDEEVLATNTGTTVNEASTGNVLTGAMLQTTDVDNTSAQLVYTMTVATGERHIAALGHGARCERYLQPSRHRCRPGHLRSQRQRDG
jgi:hypothetical protein